METATSSSSTSSCDFGCLEIFLPVCASNGQTFGNECEFNRTKCTSGDDTLAIVSRGACNSRNKSDSGESNYSCLLEFACLDVYTPVCGSDGQTYSNDCFLRRARCLNSSLTLLFDGECSGSTASERDDPVDHFSTSASSSQVCAESSCTKEFKALCGSDGVTYGNKCLFRNAQCVNSSLTIAFEGDCSTSSASSASITGPGPALRSETSISAESASDSASISRKSFALVSIMAVLQAVVAALTL